MTGLVLRGRSTHEIAEALTVTPYTVQDHLKSFFEKVDVSSRRELVAQLFLQQCAPKLAAVRPEAGRRRLAWCRWLVRRLGSVGASPGPCPGPMMDTRSVDEARLP